MGADRQEEHRQIEVMTALSQAAVAAARSKSPDAVYGAVADSLHHAGFFASIYAVEGDRARLMRSSFAPRTVRMVERRTGLKEAGFEVRLSEAEHFRNTLGASEALLFETVEMLTALLPPPVRWLAGPVARVMKIRKCIGAAVRDERGKAVGLLFLLGNQLSLADTATATVFAQLLGLTLGRTRVTQELEANMSALQQAQQQLVHAQKIEAIGRLTGGIAHDFNNLLTPALFAVGELENPGLPPAEHTESVEIIRQTLERCADLTRSLLAFGRRQVLTRKRVVLDDAVGAAMRLLRTTFQENVRIEWSPGAGNLRVDADVTQLHQVIINLALNARDAMPRGGVFKVATRPLNGDQVEIACSDTGTGIAASVQPRIFEPFFTTKGPGRGTGLGLSVVEGIVQQHGGSVEVESAEGQGTTFRLQLRVATQPELGTPPPATTKIAPSGRRVLVVEDDALVRRTLVRILSGSGYLVTEAATLAEARAVRGRSPAFHLLLTDVVLPDGNSTEDTVALHRAGQRVLFVTGHPMDAHWLPVELARLPVLQKPFGPGELLAAVESALR